VIEVMRGALSKDGEKAVKKWPFFPAVFFSGLSSRQCYNQAR